jgi:hypothetical protein
MCHECSAIESTIVNVVQQLTIEQLFKLEHGSICSVLISDAVSFDTNIRGALFEWGFAHHKLSCNIDMILLSTSIS